MDVVEVAEVADDVVRAEAILVFDAQEEPDAGHGEKANATEVVVMLEHGLHGMRCNTSEGRLLGTLGSGDAGERMRRWWCGYPRAGGLGSAPRRHAQVELEGGRVARGGMGAKRGNVTLDSIRAGRNRACPGVVSWLDLIRRPQKGEGEGFGWRHSLENARRETGVLGSQDR